MKRGSQAPAGDPDAARRLIASATFCRKRGEGRPTTQSTFGKIDTVVANACRIVEEAPNLRSRWIVEGRGEAPRPDGAFVEWELRGAGWQDRHPHSEINYILDGELHVEADGQTVVLGPGDCVRVASGESGRYWAPTYARMVAVYGANPDGAPTDTTQYWEI